MQDLGALARVDTDGLGQVQDQLFRKRRQQSFGGGQDAPIRDQRPAAGASRHQCARALGLAACKIIAAVRRAVDQRLQLVDQGQALGVPQSVFQNHGTVLLEGRHNGIRRCAGIYSGQRHGVSPGFTAEI